MGVEIKAFFEIKLNEKWYTYSQPNFKRNDELFAKMAGAVQVAGIKPIAPPRGLPDDISDVVALEEELWRREGCFYSWLNAKEIKELYDFHQQLYVEREKSIFQLNTDEWGFLCGRLWASFADHRDEFPDKIEDIRLVFWFSY